MNGTEQPERPTDGWSCREVLDAGVLAPEAIAALAIDPNDRARCAFCGTGIRWIHVLVHDEWSADQGAGCCCAARLCFAYDAATTEREVKNRTARLARFIDPRRWRRSRYNPVNICRDVRMADGSAGRVTVFLKDGRYGACLAGRKGDMPSFHPERFDTQAEAKAVAFELIDRLRDEDGRQDCRANEAQPNAG